MGGKHRNENKWGPCSHEPVCPRDRTHVTDYSAGKYCKGVFLFLGITEEVGDGEHQGHGQVAGF